MARRRKSWRYRLGMTIINVLVILFLTMPLVPAIFGSVQRERALLTDVTSPLPKEMTLHNFRVVLSRDAQEKARERGMLLPAAMGAFPRSYVNSTIIAVSVTILTLLFGSFAGYAVTRLPFRWTQWFVYGNLASRMVPIIGLMIPLYVTLGRLKLLNTLRGIIITETGFLLPFATWILMSYFAALPRELEDAARIDGCSRMGAFFRIVLPLSGPGLAATSVIMFMISWHELVIPLIVATKPEAMTVPVVLASLTTDYYVFFTLMMAICLLGLLPTVFLALLMQRYVVEGLTAGALKG